MLKFNANRMPMSDRIKTLRDYTNDYHKSLVSPEKFWGEIAENLDWRKKWIKYRLIFILEMKAQN